jgi:2-keto-3-deoxy-L-rhamnonate aldolase RhmA
MEQNGRGTDGQNGRQRSSETRAVTNGKKHPVARYYPQPTQLLAKLITAGAQSATVPDHSMVQIQESAAVILEQSQKRVWT